MHRFFLSIIIRYFFCFKYNISFIFCIFENYIFTNFTKTKSVVKSRWWKSNGWQGGGAVFARGKFYFDLLNFRPGVAKRGDFSLINVFPPHTQIFRGGGRKSKLFLLSLLLGSLPRFLFYQLKNLFCFFKYTSCTKFTAIGSGQRSNEWIEMIFN